MIVYGKRNQRKKYVSGKGFSRNDGSVGDSGSPPCGEALIKRMMTKKNPTLDPKSTKILQTLMKGSGIKKF